MAAYLVVEVNVADADEYARYRRAAKDAEADSPGFRLLTRGGWGGDDPTVGLEGDWDPELLVIVEFPSREDAEEFYYSDKYQEALKIRERSSSSRALLISSQTDL